MIYMHVGNEISGMPVIDFPDTGYRLRCKFEDEIENFKFMKGIRNVLRYKINNRSEVLYL